MQVCTQACGKTASIVFGKPLRPPTQQTSTSWTPRCPSSLRTASQNFAPSAWWNQRPTTSPLALEVDADRGVAGLVPYLAAVSDLHDQRVEEQERRDAKKTSWGCPNLTRLMLGHCRPRTRGS